MASPSNQGLSAMRFVNPDWPSSTIPASRPTPLPRSEHIDLGDLLIAANGTRISVQELHRLTASTSLIVVFGGELVYEWYADGCGPGDRFLGASMTKSVLAHAVGLAVGAGLLATCDRVVDHVPELAGSGYDGVDVENLLTMTSGVDWLEDHRDPTSLASRLVATLGHDPGNGAAGDSRALLTQVPPGVAPGTRFAYCTADSQVLDWVRERATGESFTEVAARLWHELGCVGDATVAVDGRQVPFAGGSLAASAVDWAKIALLQRNGSIVEPRGWRPVLDPSWVSAASRPSREFLRPGRLPSSITTHAGFGYHWWPLDDAGRRVTADGSRGQFAYVDRDLDVVVVKTSQWGYEDWLHDRTCRDVSYLALPAIARAASHRLAARR